MTKRRGDAVKRVPVDERLLTCDLHGFGLFDKRVDDVRDGDVLDLTRMREDAVVVDLTRKREDAVVVDDQVVGLTRKRQDALRSLKLPVKVNVGKFEMELD